MFAAGGIFAGAQLVVIHSFLGGGDLSNLPPEVPGMEWVWRGDRLHWVWRGDRLHWVAGEE